ncbi:hypothetical protein GH733_009843 [Mirounga leonina]|nr:hypothetical protein GH733_009843 [Mirounga leonina]
MTALSFHSGRRLEGVDAAKTERKDKMAMDFRQLDIHSVYNYAHFRKQCEGLWVRKEEREKPNQKRGSGSLQFFLFAWRSLCWGSGLPGELV